MEDSIGKMVEVGGYIAYSGAGNKDCEYGMIFAKVIEVMKDKVKAVRLDVAYPDFKNPVITRKICHKKAGKFVFLDRADMEAVYAFPWFDDGYEYDKEESQVIAKWIHKGILYG